MAGDTNITMNSKALDIQLRSIYIYIYSLGTIICLTFKYHSPDPHSKGVSFANLDLTHCFGKKRSFINQLGHCGVSKRAS
jgi:hypothetical protein